MKLLEQKISRIAKEKFANISGLNEEEKAFLPLFLCKKVAVITPFLENLKIYEEMARDNDKRVIVLKEKLPDLVVFNEKNMEIFKHYYISLGKILRGDFDILLLTPDVLFQKLPSKDFMLSHILKLQKSKEYMLGDIVKFLSTIGYSREEVICEKGDFALRGDILDVFPINSDVPIRITFFDNEIESICSIDLESFKVVDDFKSIDIFPATFLSLTQDEKEKIGEKINLDVKKLTLSSQSMLRILDIVGSQISYLKNNLAGVSSAFFLPYCRYFNSSLFDFLPCDIKVILDEPKLITDKLKIIEGDISKSLLGLFVTGELLPRHELFYLKKNDIMKALKKFSLIAYSRLVSQNKVFTQGELFNFTCPHLPLFVGRLGILIKFLKNLNANRATVVLSPGDDRVRSVLEEFLKKNNLDFTVALSLKDVKDEKINILMHSMVYSAYFEMEKFVLIGSSKLSPHHVIRVESKREGLKFEPKVGEFVVHEVHGIGKCIGIKNLKLTNVYRDYIIIEYRGGDRLYVPSENADMLSNYVGDINPRCNKIGGVEFFKVKEKVKKSLRKMAYNLLTVYAERRKAKGFKYSKDTYLQEAFESRFPYDYTEDQLSSLVQIKKDMESPKIMDRLLCGDVGFGKTEVALASAFKAIQDNKQVAIVCPTTILCEQHFATATERMKDFGVKVEVINRFKTRAEQKNILKNLEEGKIDLICGTHRLFKNDVKFKDLGLVIIDEEQRFGVEDKDKLKSIKSNVDVLSLSATPIPRTLYMSLTGIRDISFITTPPKERKVVETNVIDYSDNLLVEVCRKEVNRGGQVLIIYNRVETIRNFYAHVKSLLPDIKISYAHGQMKSRDLEKEIYDLYSRKTQILISTILIENGVDLPYANTLFVIDADKLGLSALYQLRGRIGRSDIKAHAYFSFSRKKILTPEAYKRLDALMEFSDFGSGYKLAMRDLEIRGAGDVLGRLQHGHMQQVGYDLYVKLLNEAVEELKGKRTIKKRDIKIEIALSAFVPKTYIMGSENCIRLYTKISNLSSTEELKALVEETKNIYGDVPMPTLELCFIGLIKNLGQKILAKKIVVNEFGGRIEFYDDVKSLDVFSFIKTISTDWVYDSGKIKTVVFRKQSDVQKQQDLLLKFLVKCTR